MSESGIYRIRNTFNGAVYIGSAVRMSARWRLHLRQLRKGSHHSVRLQRAWCRYGEGSFVSEVIEAAAPGELLSREQYWLDRLRPFGARGYNICVTAGSRLGMRASAATRAKMSESGKGRVKSPEHQAAITSALRGKKMSERQKSFLSQYRTGRKASPEARARMVEAQKNRKMDAAARERMIRANCGREFPAEHKEKISAALKGRPKSTEAREKMRIAALRRYALLREKLSRG
jgi:group I intron endonuclease